MLTSSTTLRLIAAAVLAGCFSSLAGQIDVSKLPPASDRKGLSYEKDIKPIFEASCLRCHGAEKPKAGLRLDSLEAVLKGSKEGKVVTLGDSAKSLLVHAVSQLDPELAMPPKPRAGKRGPTQGQTPGQGQNQAPGQPGRQPGPPPKPLTAEEVGLIRAWIDQGAK